MESIYEHRNQVQNILVCSHNIDCVCGEPKVANHHGSNVSERMSKKMESFKGTSGFS